MYTTETDRMLAEGGVMQEGNTVDPVSGNDVPPGAMQEEVRDDIDAKLSEGEFVIPADVVRYIGLSTLMKMRDKAKEGLKKMEEIGQMGNAEEVSNAEALHGEGSEMDDETFGAEVDSIMNEDMGDEDRAFAEGGYVDPANESLYSSAPIKGFEMVAMTNEAGNTIYIPHINGKAMLGIPAGYTVKKGILPNVTTPKIPSTSDTGGGGSGDSGGGGGIQGPTQGGPVPSFDAEGRAVAAKTGLTDKQAGIAGTVIGLVTGIPMLGLAARYGNQKANESYAKDAAAVNLGIADTMGPNFGTYGYNDQPTATMGPGGTGGQAANVGASAAAAAIAAGYSEAAIGAAGQAAASAVVNGASPTAAAEAGREAAAKVDGTTDPMDFGDIEGRGTRSVDSGTISSRGGSTGITSDPQTTVDENGQVVSTVSDAGPQAVSTPTVDTTPLGTMEGTYDLGGPPSVGGDITGGTTTDSTDTSGYSASDDAGVTGSGSPSQGSDTSTSNSSSTGDSSSTSDSSSSGGGDGGGDGGDGDYRGGFITRKNPKSKIAKKKGLASRK